MSPVAFTPSLICDILILFFLLISVVSGMKRGFILTLCGLLAVTVAFVGAYFVTNAVAPIVTPLVEPQVTTMIEDKLADYFEEHDVPELNRMSDGQLADILDQVGFPEYTFASDGDGILAESITDLAVELTGTITQTLVYCVVFLLSFLLILILWGIVSHTLDLMAKLPVIHSLNSLGGGILGFFKGCFLLFICAFALKYLWNILPSDWVAGSRVLKFFMTTNPVRLILPTVSLLSF